MDNLFKRQIPERWSYNGFLAGNERRCECCKGAIVPFRFLLAVVRPCVIPLLALRLSVALLRCAPMNFWKILMSHARLLSLKNIEKRKSQVGGLEVMFQKTKINYYFPVYAIPIPSQSNGKNYSEKPLFSECEIKDKMQIKIKKAGQIEASRKAESRIK
ncbi:hypothetical protein RIR_jg3979.t1 [Rhizophagus irregularis DAOM 181602=DAOM 197198]|nr:hypothetical protein RIR_jg3979.t1 [Rhizophagus irregularis DAOM 181602=DAOM 197198]